MKKNDFPELKCLSFQFRLVLNLHCICVGLTIAINFTFHIESKGQVATPPKHHHRIVIISFFIKCFICVNDSSCFLFLPLLLIVIMSIRSVLLRVVDLKLHTYSRKSFKRNLDADWKNSSVTVRFFR